jgi:hypothetical protein
MTELEATCPCGHTVSVSEPEGGQTLYGTVAWRMTRHEPCRNLQPRGSSWQIDHGMPDTSVEGAYQT